MNPNLSFLHAEKVCRLADGYTAYVAQVRGLWVGYMLGDGAYRSHQAGILTQARPGSLMTISDRATAIRLTAAAAEEAVNDLGAVVEWFVAEDLREAPDVHRCRRCQMVHCDGHCVTWEDLDAVFATMAEGS